MKPVTTTDTYLAAGGLIVMVTWNEAADPRAIEHVAIQSADKRITMGRADAVALADCLHEALR